MLDRFLMAIAAAAAIATAAAVSVVALAFCINALLVPPLGAAGAAGAECAIFAILVAIGGLIAMAAAKKKSKQGPAGDAISLADRLMDLVRDKPMATAGVAVAAGLMALRNPAVIAVIVRTILDALPAKGRKKS